MRQNNSVSLPLKGQQLFCKIKACASQTAKINAGTYHRLIWQFPAFLQRLDPWPCGRGVRLAERDGYSAARIASIGASRLNQMENERAPWYSNMDKPFAPRAPASSAARSSAVFDGSYTQSKTT